MMFFKFVLIVVIVTIQNSNSFSFEKPSGKISISFHFKFLFLIVNVIVHPNRYLANERIRLLLFLKSCSSLYQIWQSLNIVIRQIICWQSRGSTTVTEVKLHYFRGCGSTTVEAVKNQVLLNKLRISKFIQKWKKKILLPLLWYYHGHGSSAILLPSLWYYRGSTSR